MASPKRILIVDDEEFNRELLEGLVESVGHNRMPVLLASEADYGAWLNPKTPGRATVELLFSPTDPAVMVKHPAV